MFSGSSLFVGCAFSGATPTSSPASFFLATFAFFAFEPPSSLSDAARDDSDLRLLFEEAARFGGMEKFFDGRSEVRGKKWCLMMAVSFLSRPQVSRTSVVMGVESNGTYQ